MKSHNELLVTQLSLVENGGIDNGLVLATATPVEEGVPIRTVQVLTNLGDAWWIGRTVRVTVEWDPSEWERQNAGDSEGYVLERPLAAMSLEPGDFTDESIGEAPFNER